MNQNGYNSQEEQIIDVPYYTRGLSDGNLRISRRIIRAQNVINYRRKISEIFVNEKTFRTDRLNQVINDAVKLLK